MQRRPGSGVPRLPGVRWLLVLALLLAALGHLTGAVDGPRGGTSSDRTSGAWTVSSGSQRSVAPVSTGASARTPVSTGGRAATTSRVRAHPSSSPTAVVSGRTDRIAGGATPLPAWAPESVLLAGPPLLPGQLPRPPTVDGFPTDLAALRGRAPPGSAGT